MQKLLNFCRMGLMLKVSTLTLHAAWMVVIPAVERQNTALVKRDWCSSKKRYDWRNAAVIDLEIIV